MVGKKHENSSLWLQYISLALVVYGIVVRLIQYLHNRSLWYDEASIALNVINRSYLELLNPLDHNQAAPPGFLWVEKLAVQLWGDSEYVLRIFPLVASVVSLIAFYYFARRYASPLAATIAIALFASLRYTVYYATEVKQYSSDVMVAILLCLLLIPLRQLILSKNKLIWLSFAGAIATWLSHPTVFILGGIELGYLLTATNRQRIYLLLNRLPVYLTWLLSFGSLYFLTIRNTMGNETLTNSWEERFPSSFIDIVWLFDALGRFFYRPLGFPGIIDAIAIVAFILGCIVYYRRKKPIFLALVAPFFATFLASYLHKYPFRDRLVFFLVPLALLLISEGVIWLSNYSVDKKNTLPISRWQGLLFSPFVFQTVSICLLLILLLPPIYQATKLIKEPKYKEEMRPVLQYITSHQQTGDYLYIYRKGKNQFMYYADRYGYEPGDYFLGEYQLSNKQENSPRKRNLYESEFEEFLGQKRVWLLFRAEEEEAPNLLSYPNLVGEQIDVFCQPGVFVYLYDLS